MPGAECLYGVSCARGQMLVQGEAVPGAKYLCGVSCARGQTPVRGAGEVGLMMVLLLWKNTRAVTAQL